MVTPDGAIVTVAGTGTSGFSGDGGQATAAQLYTPQAVALDGAGNFYIADSRNNRVRKVTPGGIISTVAGTGSSGFSGDGGQGTAAQVSFPSGVAADASGNLYIADTENSRIRRVSPDGVITTFAGGVYGISGDGGPAAGAGLMLPYGLSADAYGGLYIADVFGNNIRKVSSGGIISTVAGTGSQGFSGDGGPAASAQLNNPYGVAIDLSGNLYIGDTFNQRIRKVSLDGTIATIAGTGNSGFSGDGGPATAAQLYFPMGLALDSSGNLYAAVQANQRIRVIQQFNPAALAIAAPAPLPLGMQGALYYRMLVATGGVPPYKWSVAYGALPIGLNLSSDGLISGVPFQWGPFRFAVTVRDSATPVATVALSQTIVVRQVSMGRVW
jgi:sugar lactone lactonase YvrE